MITSTSCSTPSAVTTPSGGDALDRLGDELDVVAGQRPGPDAVVAQDPLGDRRVVRDHLLEQLGVVGELGREVLGEQLADHLVDHADRPLLRLATRGRPGPSASSPSCVRQKSHSRDHSVVGRHVVEQPADGPSGRSSWYSGVSNSQFGVRWKIVSSAACSATIGDELGSAGAGADDRDALAVQVDVVVPARRVERRAGEVVEAGDVGQVRAVELADRADHGVNRRRLGRPVGRSRADLPGRGVLVERGVDDLGLEADVRAQRRARRRTGGSSRAASAWSRSAAATRAGRTSSCRGGWRRRPGSPGRCSRTRCRRRRRSSRGSRTARRPARGGARRAMPDIPAPTIATVNGVSGAMSSLCHAGRPEVLAADRELLAQHRRSTRRPRPSSVMRYAISRRSSSSVGSGAGGDPASR